MNERIAKMKQWTIANKELIIGATIGSLIAATTTAILLSMNDKDPVDMVRDINQTPDGEIKIRFTKGDGILIPAGN